MIAKVCADAFEFGHAIWRRRHAGHARRQLRALRDSATLLHAALLAQIRRNDLGISSHLARRAVRDL
jgi:hypothetical protein